MKSSVIGIVRKQFSRIQSMPFPSNSDGSICSSRPLSGVTSSWSPTRQLFPGNHLPCSYVLEFRSTTRSTKRLVLYDFGGLRRSPRVCKSLKNLKIQLSRQRSRVRPRRPRHTFQNTYGTYGANVTSKSGFDMGAIRNLPPILRVFFLLHFTQIWNHHLHNLALCCPLVRAQCLCVNIERDPAIRVP